MATPNPFKKPAAGPVAGKPAAAPAPSNLPSMGGVAAGAGGDFPELDLTNVESSGKIDPGTYPMYLDAVEMATSQAGNAMIVWTFRIFNTQRYDNRALKLRTALTEKAMFKVKQVADALGQPAKFTPGPHLRGTIVYGIVTEGEWDGKPTYNLDEVLPPDEELGGPGSKVNFG